MAEFWHGNMHLGLMHSSTLTHVLGGMERVRTSLLLVWLKDISIVAHSFIAGYIVRTCFLCKYKACLHYCREHFLCRKSSTSELVYCRHPRSLMKRSCWCSVKCTPS